jgi:hypothetical protein
LWPRNRTVSSSWSYTALCARWADVALRSLCPCDRLARDTLGTNRPLHALRPSNLRVSTRWSFRPLHSVLPNIALESAFACWADVALKALRAGWPSNRRVSSRWANVALGALQSNPRRPDLANNALWAYYALWTCDRRISTSWPDRPLWALRSGNGFASNTLRPHTALYARYSRPCDTLSTCLATRPLRACYCRSCDALGTSNSLRPSRSRHG